MTTTPNPMTLEQVQEDLAVAKRALIENAHGVTCDQLNRWKSAIDAELAKQRNAEKKCDYPECNKHCGKVNGYCSRSDQHIHPHQRNAALPISAEKQFEDYVQSLIAKNPDIREIGERLSRLLDEDDFNTIEPMLLGLARQRNAAQVTDEDVERALKAFNTARNYEGNVAGVAMRAALSAVASRDRGDAELFGIHMIGPDDIIAAPSKEAAERVVNNFNQYWDDHKNERGHDVHVIAKVIVWEFGAVEHAKDVIKSFGEYVDLLEPFDAARKGEGHE